MVDAAGAQEQECLEEGMGQQVEQPRRPAADAQGQHHEAKLADRRISQHLLVIGLDHRDRRRDEQRDPAGVGDEKEHVAGEQREKPPDQVNPRRHHGRRVNQGRDRRRTGHGVGQPDVKRKLGAFPDAAGENPQARQGQHPERDLARLAGGVVRLDLMGLPDRRAGRRRRRSARLTRFKSPGCTAQALVDFLKAERAQAGPEQAQAHQHADVADPVDDERLVGRVAVDFLLVPEADQQVRADADQLPEDEDHEDVARGDQAEHREAKEREIGEEPRITRVVVHVAHRVDVDQGRDERDHEEHDDAQIVDRDSQGNRPGRARWCRPVPAAAPPPQNHPVDTAGPDERLVVSVSPRPPPPCSAAAPCSGCAAA